MRKFITKIKLKRRKRRRKWLAIFILVFGIIFYNGANKVWADDIYNFSRNRVDGIYAVTRLNNGELHYYYLNMYTMNDRIAYCIEPGVKIDDINSYYGTDDFSGFPYSSGVLDYIEKILYYGYDYPGHGNNYYYMASQELIWEYLGNDVYWSYGIDEQEIDISSYKNEIIGLINGDRDLNIDNIYLDVYNDTYGDYILYNNIMLSDYVIVDSSLSSVSLDNGILSIYNDGNIDNQYIKVKKKNYSMFSPLLLYNSDNQKMVAAGMIHNSEYIINIKVNYVNFNLHKVEKELGSVSLYGNRMLEGAKYGLYDYNNDLVTILETDRDGEAYVEGLLYGTYYLKEIEASYGYEIDENFYTLEFNQIDNEFFVYEMPSTRKLEIYKTYGDNYNYEDGVVFEIYTEDLELYGSIVTDSSGYGYIELPYGNYYVKQLNSIDGYIPIDDFMVTINNNSDKYIYQLNDKEIVKFNPSTYDNVFYYLVFIVLSIVFMFYLIIRLHWNSSFGIKVNS